MHFTRKTRHVPAGFSRDCTKTSSSHSAIKLLVSNAAGPFFSQVCQVYLGTHWRAWHHWTLGGRAMKGPGHQVWVHWDGDFRWFKVSEDFRQPQLLVVHPVAITIFLPSLGDSETICIQFPNISSGFYDQFLHTEFSLLLTRNFLATNALCFLTESRNAPWTR